MGDSGYIQPTDVLLVVTLTSLRLPGECYHSPGESVTNIQKPEDSTQKPRFLAFCGKSEDSRILGTTFPHANIWLTEV